MLKSLHILSIKVTTSIKKDIIKSIEDYLIQKNSEAPLTIFSVNPEIVIEAQKNPQFAMVLNSADICLPDGAGVVWALNQKNKDLRIQACLPAGRSEDDKKGHSRSLCHSRENGNLTRISGIDFMEELVNLAARKGYPVALIGGKDGVAGKTLDYLQKHFSGLKGWAEELPEFRIQNSEFRIQNDQQSPQTNDEFLKQLSLRIQKSGVKLVFVGLGAPKQEFFIKAVSHQLSAIRQRSCQPSAVRRSESSDLKADSLIFMSVGGAFDILSGKLPRAPKIIQKLNLEWLWRLIWEPQRVFRQINLLKFVFLVIRERSMVK